MTLAYWRGVRASHLDRHDSRQAINPLTPVGLQPGGGFNFAQCPSVDNYATDRLVTWHVSWRDNHHSR
jgi:hypothetical protein